MKLNLDLLDLSLRERTSIIIYPKLVGSNPIRKILFLVALFAFTVGGSFIINYATAPSSYALSAAGPIVAPPTFLIVPPTNLKSNETSTNAAALTWSPSTIPNTAVYVIYQNGVQIGTTNYLTSNYLAINLTPGTTYTYTVSIKVGSTVSAQSIPLKITTGSTPHVISQCSGQALPSGNYILTANLSTPGSQCFTFVSTNHVSLDCQNHSINVGTYNTPIGGAVSLNKVSNFLIKNCIFPNTIDDIYAMVANSSTLGTFAGNKFLRGAFQVNNGDNLVVYDNTFTNADYTQLATSNSSIDFNRGTNPVQKILAAFISSAGGSSNIIDQNTLNGGSYTSANYYNGEGTDDGIVLGAGQALDTHEDSDIIFANTINGTFDCGIETTDFVTNTTIQGNVMNYVSNCGIGAWYWDSWMNNTVSNNTADHTDRLFDFYNMGGVPAGQTEIYFENNSFVNNRLGADNGYGLGNFWEYASYFAMYPYEQPGLVYVTGNNLFKDNNFGHGRPALSIEPTSTIVDGGGNICTTPSTPLVCN